MRTSDLLTEQITELYLEQSHLYEQRNELFRRPDYSANHIRIEAELASLASALDDVHERIDRLKRERDTARTIEATAFVRPTTGFAGLMSRLLGPLPAQSVIINPTKENLRRVPSQVLPAIGLILVAIAALVGLSAAAPWLRVSPYSVIYGSLEPVAGSWTTAIAVVICVALNSVLSRGFITARRYDGKLLDKAAMAEEQWFRMGAESWSMRARITGCVSFGFIHVINMIYPVSSLIVASMIGGLFMATYLRAYKRTRSVELATLTSTRLHATYNRFAVAYVIVALAVTLSVTVAR